MKTYKSPIFDVVELKLSDIVLVSGDDALIWDNFGSNDSEMY